MVRRSRTLHPLYAVRTPPPTPTRSITRAHAHARRFFRTHTHARTHTHIKHTHTHANTRSAAAARSHPPGAPRPRTPARGLGVVVVGGRVFFRRFPYPRARSPDVFRRGAHFDDDFDDQTATTRRRHRDDAPSRPPPGPPPPGFPSPCTRALRHLTAVDSLRRYPRRERYSFFASPFPVSLSLSLTGPS